MTQKLPTPNSPSENKLSGDDGFRDIKIQRLDVNKFLLDGTEGWATPCKSDLLVHDIFHHDPSDDGSMACELMSYGAQVWIEHHRDEIRLGVSFEELSAILEDTVENKTVEETVEILMIGPAPDTQQPEARFIERFKEVAVEAFQESAISEAMEAIPDDIMGTMCDDENIDRYAAWMSHGFMRAKERFPDPEATFILFNQLHRAIKEWSTGGEESLVLNINEKTSTVTSPNANFQDIFHRVGVGSNKGLRP